MCAGAVLFLRLAAILTNWGIRHNGLFFYYSVFNAIASPTLDYRFIALNTADILRVLHTNHIELNRCAVVCSP